MKCERDDEGDKKMIQPDYTYFARIINVVDGDTVDLLVELGFYVSIRERFRLSFIDTPELNSPNLEERAAAVRARDYVMQYLGMGVRLKSTKKDKYGRFLAEIFVEGQTVSINQQLLDLGLARPY